MSQLLFAQTYPIGSPLTTGVIQTVDGDYVLAGRLFEPNSNSSAFALRVQSFGNVTWEKTYSSSFSVFFKSITQIADGSLVATGTFFYSNTAGDEYLWIVKLDPQGNKIWEKALGAEDEQNDGYDIIATVDGGFIVTGLILEKGTDKAWTWVLKFDADGNLQWDRKFDNGVAFRIIQTKDDGYALSGMHNLPGSLNSNVYILRLDPNGAKVWEKVYPDLEIYVLLDSGITETKDGHFAVAAKSVLMEVDSCGNIFWARQNNSFELTSIVQTPDGLYAVGGNLIDSRKIRYAYVAVIDQTGDKIQWDNTEILNDSGMGQILINQDGFVTGGGYVLNSKQDLAFLAVFNPSTTVV